MGARWYPDVPMPRGIKTAASNHLFRFTNKAVVPNLFPAGHIRTKKWCFPALRNLPSRYTKAAEDISWNFLSDETSETRDGKCKWLTKTLGCTDIKKWELKRHNCIRSNMAATRSNVYMHNVPLLGSASL